jgi:hypothetical protein
MHVDVVLSNYDENVRMVEARCVPRSPSSDVATFSLVLDGLQETGISVRCSFV